MTEVGGERQKAGRAEARLLPAVLVGALLVGIAWNLLALGSGDLPLYLKRIWRNRERPAVDRSAALFLGSVGASYIHFLRETLPPEATVVLAPGYPTGHEGIMEYFLIPRTVHACNAPFEQCARMYAGPTTYALATRGYALPQPEALGYRWEPFAEANWEFQGYYAPLASVTAVRPLGALTAAELVQEIAMGILLVLTLAFIGIGVACGLVGSDRPVMTLACGFPLGAGLVTFSLFILSWAGIRMDSGLLLAVLTGWSAAVLLVCRRAMGSWGGALSRSLKARELHHSRRTTVLMLGLLALVGLSFLLAVGLSYYEDDELAIWSTKGYGMVLEGSVRAGEAWGAHGLSYPLNIPLLIGAFRLAAAEQVPISKLAFPLFYACLLLGIGDFWRRHGLGRLNTGLVLLFLATIPLVQFHSTLGLANLPLAIYLVMGVLVAIDGYDGRSIGATVLAGLLLAIGAWTRAEAMLYAATLLAALLVLGRAYTRERRRYLAALAVPMFLGTGAWLAFALPSVLASHLGGAVNEFGQSLSTAAVSWAPMGTLATAFAKTALHKERWAALLPLLAFLLGVAVLRRKEGKQRVAGWLVLAGALLMVEVVSIFFIRSYSRADFDILVGRAIHRHLMPAFLLLLVGASIAALRERIRASLSPADSILPPATSSAANDTKRSTA